MGNTGVVARKIEVTAFDDLTGEPAVSTVVFGHRGRWFEIDLDAANTAEITALLERWSTAGRPVPRTGEARAGGHRSQADRARVAAIRVWAAQQGLEVAPKGRLPAAVIRAYGDVADTVGRADHR